MTENERRADKARRTLDQAAYGNGDFVDDMVDLLSDMMHCVEQQTGESFDDLVRRARDHYATELEDAA